MDDSTNVFFEKDETRTDSDDEKSAAKKSKTDDSEFYDDMPREIVEYLIKTHPLNEDNVKTRRRSHDENRTGSKVKSEVRSAASGRSRLASYESNVTPKRAAYNADEFDDDEADDYSYIDDEAVAEKTTVKNYSSSPIINTRIILILIIVLVILIMLFLVIRNNQLAKQIADSETLITQAESIKGLNDRLTTQVDELHERIAELESTTQNSASGNTPATSSSQNSAAESNTDSGTSTADQNVEKTYTVKKGDNLSKISKDFYGNAGYYLKIMEYNNLTSDSLTVGTELKIPPLE